MRRLLLAASLACAWAAPAAAQDTHLIVVTGVAGDEERAAQFHKWGAAIVDAARRLGVPDTGVTYLADKPDLDPARIRGRSTKDNVAKAIADTAARAKPNDEVFILLIGHGSFDGRIGAFNLPGPDLAVAEYATLLDQLAAQRVVFVNTASSSGAFIEPLAAPGRIIVAATKTGGERNETRFPAFFVEAFQDETADRDRNGRVSTLEAFDYARAKVVASYEQGGHILTEHAVLDDGSEGKLAAMLFLAPRAARAAALATADPKLRALIEERDALERQVAELRLRKDRMDEVRYTQELEELLTSLALKTRTIRELEAKK
jgi:hypothetical protein